MSDRIEALRHPDTIRLRCGEVTAALEAGDGRWRVDRGRLRQAARLVAEVTRERYPDLDVPVHGRWRHFAAGGTDRTAALPLPRDPVQRGRVRLGLVVVSVLLDAGAGPGWRFMDAGGIEHRRSEGLAVATFEAFISGRFSGSGIDPAADADGLASLDLADLEKIFAVSSENPIVGLPGRLSLLHRLAAVARRLPGGRVGGIYDLLVAASREGAVAAQRVLGVLLSTLAQLWPDSTHVDGKPVGDVWPHPAAGGDGLVPFHKLCQWLAYSLVSPLADCGLDVSGLDRLTALPEYRNGGLLVDSGVLAPVDPRDLDGEHGPGDPLVVEWRAATVTLVDALAELVREDLDRPELSLGQVLEGGTWWAGRRLAEERRPDGAPPVRVRSDGTLF